MANTHSKLLVFSSLGKVYSLKSFDIPETSLKARGKPIVNLLPFSPLEKIATILPLPINESEWSKQFVIFLTKNGMVRKNKLVDVAKSGKRDLRGAGKLSIKLNNKDELIGVELTKVTPSRGFSMELSMASSVVLASRLGLPGLALTGVMWAYDKWKNRDKDDEFKVRRYRDDDED